MDWIEALESALEYIEDHIAEEMTVQEIAGNAHISAFYFQKGFAMLCGYSVGEYVRMRRLSLAGSELLAGDCRVVDLAVKYGCETVDFPSISTGVYSFPLDKAAPIAIGTIAAFLEEHPQIRRVRMVCFDLRTKSHYDRALEELA